MSTIMLVRCFVALLGAYGTVAIAQAQPLDECCELRIVSIQAVDCVEDGDEIYMAKVPLTPGRRVVPIRPLGDPDYWRFDEPRKQAIDPTVIPPVLTNSQKAKEKVRVELKEQQPGTHRTLGAVEFVYDGARITFRDRVNANTQITSYDMTTRTEILETTFEGKSDGRDYKYLVRFSAKYVTGRAYCLFLNRLSEVTITKKEGSLDGNPRDELIVQAHELDPMTGKRTGLSHPPLPGPDDYYEVFKGEDCRFTNQRGEVQTDRSAWHGVVKPGEKRSIVVELIEQDGPIFVKKIKIEYKDGKLEVKDFKIGYGGNESLGTFRIDLELDKQGDLKATWSSADNATTSVIDPVTSNPAQQAEGVQMQIRATGGGADYRPIFSLLPDCKG